MRVQGIVTISSIRGVFRLKVEEEQTDFIKLIFGAFFNQRETNEIQEF